MSNGVASYLGNLGAKLGEVGGKVDCGGLAEIAAPAMLGGIGDISAIGGGLGEIHKEKKAMEAEQAKRLMDMIQQRISAMKEFDIGEKPGAGAFEARKYLPGVFESGYLKRKPMPPTWPGMMMPQGGEIPPDGIAGIPVISPDGAEGTIPAGELLEALKLGYKLKQ